MREISENLPNVSGSAGIQNALIPKRKAALYLKSLIAEKSVRHGTKATEKYLKS